MSKIVAIVQARMGATRLPGKVMADIVGKPLLWHVINRIKRAKLIGEIVIATTTDREDDVIEKWAKENNLKCYRGSADDVLDRFYQAAKKYGASIIVRVTADDPLKDPVLIDKVIRYYLEHKDKFDYVSNIIKPTYPEGLDVEVFPLKTLERAWREASTKVDREHVTTFIWNNPDKFRLANIEHVGEDISHLRWTLDYPEDLIFTREVYAKLYKKGEVFLMEDVLNLLKRCPELAKINAGHFRFEGYLKSLKEK
ncbi:MAG: glycosyltransferase family protein [Candidatus Hadarchaeum sp.]